MNHPLSVPFSMTIVNNQHVYHLHVVITCAFIISNPFHISPAREGSLPYWSAASGKVSRLPWGVERWIGIPWIGQSDMCGWFCLIQCENLSFKSRCSSPLCPFCGCVVFVHSFVYHSSCGINPKINHLTLYGEIGQETTFLERLILTKRNYSSRISSMM